jgi:hypothetical protein
MTLLESLARAEAAVSGRAQRLTTVRHTHLVDRPLVLVPLMMAGEAAAPLGILIGQEPEHPRLLVVPQPRDPGLRMEFLAGLAREVLPWLDGHCQRHEAVPAGRRGKERLRYAEAPQLVVPNTAAVQALRLLGRATRFRRPGGRYPVDVRVPLLGRWLTYLAERAEQPGSAQLLAATRLLSGDWATGQSGLEDESLGALLGWIDPPTGLTGAEAAALAEERDPPAGPSTDPDWDNRVLAPLIAGYDAGERGAADAIAEAVRAQLTGGWRLVWRAIALLRQLPAGAHVAARWEADKDSFTGYAVQTASGGPPQPRRDGAVAAAARLDRLERDQARYDAQRALDDPLVMAEFRLAGEAFAGRVVEVLADRRVGAGRSRVLRPLVTVETCDRTLLPTGTALVAPGRPGQPARVVEVGSGRVVVELVGGVGRGAVPQPGSLPQPGERICYTALADPYCPPAAFPDRAATPWTHGGPPREWAAADEAWE